jgi:hypothetical protein
VLILGLIALIIVSIKPAFAAVSPYSVNVAFTASDSLSIDPIGIIALDVNVTLEFETVYSCSVSGDLLSTAVCNVDLAPRSAAVLTVDYFIDFDTGPNLSGHKSVTLSQQGNELLGDSAPIKIPIDESDTITVVIHGRLFGNVGVDSSHYISLEWPTWGNKSINMTATTQFTPLLIAKYNYSFTVTVSVSGSKAVTKTTYPQEVFGNPSEMIIPEFPLIQTLYLFMIATFPAIAVYKKRHQK